MWNHHVVLSKLLVSLKLVTRYLSSVQYRHRHYASQEPTVCHTYQYIVRVHRQTCRVSKNLHHCWNLLELCCFSAHHSTKTFQSVRGTHDLDRHASTYERFVDSSVSWIPSVIYKTSIYCGRHFRERRIDAELNLTSEEELFHISFDRMSLMIFSLRSKRCLHWPQYKPNQSCAKSIIETLRRGRHYRCSGGMSEQEIGREVNPYNLHGRLFRQEDPQYRVLLTSLWVNITTDGTEAGSSCHTRRSLERDSKWKSTFTVNCPTRCSHTSKLCRVEK